MSRLRLPMHGRDHRPGGADPLPGVIVFDAENVGGYLHIETTAEGIILKADNFSIVLDSGEAINEIDAGGATWDFRGGTGGVVNAHSYEFNWETESGDDYNVTAGGVLSLAALETILIHAFTSPITLNVNNNLFEFRDDGTIHGPTGGSIVWDM